MLIQYKLQPHPDEDTCYLRGPKFCIEYFYQASTVVRLVRAIVKVWGASRDVVYMICSYKSEEEAAREEYYWVKFSITGGQV